MATKLKNLKLTSVDLVRAGANQEADICLYKSVDPETPTAHETGIFKRFLNWLRDNPADEKPGDTVEKDFVTFDQVNDNRENQDKLWRYTDALTCSLRSIQEDHDLGSERKAEMMQESVQQFVGAMTAMIRQLCNVQEPAPGVSAPANAAPVYDEIEEV